ncbi:hypothetical protein RF663_09355 [Aeromonas veronii]|uniref:hypothetical protein n=1 Tax=Aeromonas veronii TaxID=654 RepID=UPI0028532E4A|nr:hypothetical protein [Aeromonas veronii]MDR5014431.1 hypothetical protein [Aeromonas veronii]
MYIEIESSQRSIPCISFKRDCDSNVIKKSELRLYKQAQTLLDSVKGRVGDYQSILEQEVIRLFDEKEKSLNTYMEKVFKDSLERWNSDKKQWLADAEEKLSALLIEQSQSFLAIKDELKRAVVMVVQSKLGDISRNETLIQHLVEVLHMQIDDASRCLKVDSHLSETGVTLFIEDDERCISIDTSDLIAQLRMSLDKI